MIAVRWVCGVAFGHPGESRAERAERLLEHESDRRAALQARLDQTRASLTATKGVVTKQRKKLDRVQHGVCPHCNRTFVNLARHMESKHPCS